MTEEERRHGVEELVEKIAIVQATLHAHVRQEDRDREQDLVEKREIKETLLCIKKSLHQLESQFTLWKGAVGLGLKVLAFLGVVSALVIAWFK